MLVELDEHINPIDWILTIEFGEGQLEVVMVAAMIGMAVARMW